MEANENELLKISQEEVIGPNFSFRIGEELKSSLLPTDDVKVFKCIDGQNNHERIMKRISKAEESIVDEIKRLVELKEVLPCSIIKYYVHFSIKDAFYFVTDPYENSNMEKLLMKLNRKGRAISASKIIDFAMQILDALAFIHSRKIIHRDIRPKNLLIDELGHVILADFRLKSQLDIFSDDVKESLNYLSPELFDNNGYDYTHKIDIWSFGCVLYELITFKKVIEGSSIVQIAPKINQFTTLPSLPSDIDSDLEFVLKNTLQKDPEDRKEADVLRDQLSSSYEKENKEKFCFLLRDMSISSNASLDRMQSVMSSSSGIGSGGTLAGSSLLNTSAAAASSSSSSHLHSPSHFGAKDKRNLIKSIQEIQSIGDIYFDEKNYSKAVLSYLEELSQKQENEIRAEFLNRIGLTYEYLDDYSNAIKFYKRSLALLENKAGAGGNNEPSAEIAKCLQNVAIAARNCGEFSEALDYDMRSLDMRIKYYGGSDHIDIADSYNTCGDAYSSLGEFSSALAYYKKSLEMRRRLAPNQTSSELAHLLNCIGVIYDRLENYEEALDYKLQALRMRSELHREDHRDVASSLNSVGVAYDRLNDYTSAIASYLKSLDMRYRLLKTKNPDEVADKNIGDLLFNLGVAYENLRNFKVALDYYHKSLEMRRRIYKDEANKRHEIDHVDIADSLKSIGSIYSKLGEHEKSLEYMLKCFEIKQRIYLEDHPELAECLDSIGHSYECIGKHKIALEYFLKSWDMRKNIYSSDHLMIANSLVNIADSYVNQGDHTKAIFYYFKCIDMRERLLQNNSIGIADLYDKIALAYFRSNDYQAALGFYNDSLKMRQKVYEDEPNQPEIAATHVLIGDIYSNLGEYQLALNSYTIGLSMYRALAASTETESRPSETMASLLNKIGDSYMAQSEPQSALRFYSDSLSMHKILCPSDDRIIVKMLFNLGVVYLSLDETSLAIENLEMSLEMLKRLSGDSDSTEMAECHQYIGDSYTKVYNYKKAQEFYIKCIEMQKRLNEPAMQIAMCLNKLGVCAFESDESKNSLEYFNESLRLLKETLGGESCDHVEIARTLNYIGEAHQSLGECKEAFENKWRSFEMRKRIYVKRDHSELAESLDALGTAYDALESYKNALEYKMAGLSMRRRLHMDEENNLEVADSLANIGKTYELMGNLKMASDHYYQSLIMKRKLLGEEHPSIFKLHNMLAHVEMSNNPNSSSHSKDSKESKEHKFHKPKLFKKPNFFKKPHLI